MKLDWAETVLIMDTQVRFLIREYISNNCTKLVLKTVPITEDDLSLILARSVVKVV